MVERYIQQDQDIAGYDAEHYAQEVWENLEFTNELDAWEEGGIDFVNDLEEARARVTFVVVRCLKEEQEWRAATR